MDTSLFLYFSNITLVISPQFIEATKRTHRKIDLVIVVSTIGVHVIQPVVVHTATSVHKTTIIVPSTITVGVVITRSEPYITTLPKFKN